MIEKELLLKMGFTEVTSGRFLIQNLQRTVNDTFVFTQPDSKLHAHGIPLVEVESADHLREVLQALRVI